MRSPSSIVAVLLLCVSAGAAQRGADSLRPRPLDWDATVCVRGFDPALGTPTLVRLRLQRHVVAHARVENTAAGAAAAAFTYAVDLRLHSPAGELLAQRLISGWDASDLAAFDGVADLSGPSSAILGTEHGDVEWIEITDPVLIEQFRGEPALGLPVRLPVAAAGEAHLAAPDGALRATDLRAGVRVVVEYR